MAAQPRSAPQPRRRRRPGQPRRRRRPSQHGRTRTLAVMLGVAAVVVTADAVSKALVLRDLPGRLPVRLLGGLLTLRLTVNPGAAFGVGTSYTAIIALIACGVVVYVVRMAARLRSLS